MTAMIQIKERKTKYRNLSPRKKAAFRGHGFQLDSKTYQKSLNLIKPIIRRKAEKSTVFLEILGKGGGSNE